ncbi:glycosyltransferase [Sorangium sp. So ce861]|uniref:glycosyltransferase n=1 Tax=Sorangium sp. So ce861 TaxID=3133323 RepID=UPI003F5DECB8
MREPRERARVAMLTCELDPIRCGGLATMVTALCRSLDPARFQPVVVLPRSGHTPPWPHVERRLLPYCAADRYQAEGAEVWLLSNPLLDSGGVIYPEPYDHAGIKKTDEYGERVAELLGALDARLLHLHDAYAYKCLYEARRLGLPTVLTIHRLHEDEPPLAFAEMASAQLATAVTTVSDAYRRERDDFFSARQDVQVIPNGIDLDVWSEDALPPEPGGRAARRRRLLRGLELPDRPTFAFVGRFDRDQKGLDVLLDAHHGGLRGAPLNLIVAGEGDRALAERIAAAAAAAGDQVRLLHRMLPPEEVRALLAAADFAVIPSRYEPFGLILIEALAMGAIPIASRVGGLSDVLAGEPPGASGPGRCFEAGDAAGLAAAMREMARLALAVPEAIDDARRAARARAEAYSARRMAARYEALYTALLGARALPAAGRPADRSGSLAGRA